VNQKQTASSTNVQALKGRHPGAYAVKVRRQRLEDLRTRDEMEALSFDSSLAKWEAEQDNGHEMAQDVYLSKCWSRA
jgi:hypothetical protein